MKSIHIYDLDGTIIDSSHRYKTIHNGVKLTIDLAHWLANVKHSRKDKLLPLAEQYKKMRADPNVYTIWCTARQTAQVTPFMDWFQDTLGLPNRFICRPDGNNESGAILKSKQLKSFLNLKQFQNVPIYFYEDNLTYLNAVCDNIGSIGIYVPSQQGH